ncbi:MAG: NADP-dependent oxidoreductase [Bryobacteraceae bacterium]|jgi:NADPH:quinone reductase-like Zn-dependent oxidoreductase
MPRAVRFDKYGGLEVLQVVEVERPTPGPGKVLVRVKAAGINPGEASIRKGMFADRWPSTFPSGQGSDLAGIVEEVGPGLTPGVKPRVTPGVTNVAVGDEVIGFTNDRSSQAEFVVVESGNLVPRPGNVSWEQAGALFVAGTTAYAAVRSVALSAGDTVVVSGAAGGVGSIAVQLARNAGAKVIGLSSDANRKWLADHGVIPVTYGDGVEDRVRAAAGGKIDAFVDTFGGGYVQLALKLGVAPNRIDTIIDFAAAAKYGVKTEGNHEAANADVLAQLSGLVAAGRLEIPMKVYPLAEVRDAYRELEQRHTRGKIVLEP